MARAQMGKSRLILTMTPAILVLLFLVTFVNSEDKPQQILDEKAKKRVLKREAVNALWRLKNTLEKEGFYSGRIRLNIWRSTAMDAGTFDQAKYDEFKKQLYEKSISDSLRCIEDFIMEDNFYDANICLQVWRMHSKELGTYDQEEYEALKKRLADAKTMKASKETEAQTPD